MLVSLERFRGFVSAFNEKQTPEIELVPFEGGWVMSLEGNILHAARGERRVFRTVDAGVRYVRDNVVGSVSRAVAVRVTVVPGLF